MNGPGEWTKFESLFRGRDDAWGLVHGEQKKGTLSYGHFVDHLVKPDRSLGIYPLIQNRRLAAEWADRMGGPVGDNFVRWGCTDIDNKDNPEACWPLAVNLHGALGALGVTSWVERTKGKGYHVWVFADEWVPAIVMRRALLVGHQVAGVAPTEVNPKQLDVGARVKYGNYVNLPYPHGARDRRVVLDLNGHVEPLEEFVDRAWLDRNSFDTLHTAAKLYKEPPKPERVVVDRPPSTALEPLISRLPGLAFKIWKEGVLPGRDRSGTLQRLAFLCAETGFTAGETYLVVEDADARWGKFSGRADCEEQLNAIVGYAFR